jgi:septum formation protein
VSPMTAGRTREPRKRRPGEPGVVLASESPRRRRLLRQVVPRFRVVPPGMNEERFRGPDPAAFALRAARAKARAVGEKYPDSLVIAADTLVSLGSRVFGKPRNRSEARAMLRALSGRRHRVTTAVVLYRAATGRMLDGRATSRVTFRKLSRADVERYLDRVDYLDKAGAYAIQESGEDLVARLDGDFDNVVGFPTGLVHRLMERWRRINTTARREARKAPRRPARQ